MGSIEDGIDFNQDFYDQSNSSDYQGNRSNRIKQELAKFGNDFPQDYMGADIAKWSGNSLTADVARLSKEVKVLKQELNGHKPTPRYEEYSYERVQDAEPITGTEYQTENSTYTVDWDNHTVKGGAFGELAQPFSDMQVSTDNNGNCHLQFTKMNNEVIVTTAVTGYKQVNIDNHEAQEVTHGVEIATASGSKYVVNKDEKTIEVIGGKYDGLKIDYENAEIKKDNPQKGDYLLATLDDGRELRTSSIVEMNEVEMQPVLEYETISGNTYYYNTVEQTITADSGPLSGGIYKVEDYALRNGRLIVDLEDGRMLKSSTVNRVDKSMERASEREERINQRDMDYER